MHWLYHHSVVVCVASTPYCFTLRSHQGCMYVSWHTSLLHNPSPFCFTLVPSPVQHTYAHCTSPLVLFLPFTLQPTKGSPSLQSLVGCESTDSMQVTPQLLAVWPRKCAFIVEEILQTENAYLMSLTETVKVREQLCAEVYGCALKLS